MLRLTATAMTCVCVLILTAASAHAAAPPAADALTENTASDWAADAQNANAEVYDDTTRVKVGSASIRFETDGGFDTWLYTPSVDDAHWDFLAAGSGGLAFWVYTENPNIGFQGPSPWVRLYTGDADYFQFSPNTDLLNLARNNWVYVEIPFNGDATWTRTDVGSPDFADINWLEIHGDTWDAGFTMWIDGLNFDLSLAPPEALLAIAGNGAVSLEWLPWSDPTNLFDYYAIYRSASPFTDTSGMTPIHTLSSINSTSWTDTGVSNGTSYYYAVTAILTDARETSDVDAVGPRTPRSETDLQITAMQRTPRYPRYAPTYTSYTVTEPSGYGPYNFTAATGLGSGQTGATPRWPTVGQTVTYIAQIRNRGTNTFSGTLSGTWTVAGSVAATPSKAVTLAPGEYTTFELADTWDDTLYEIEFTLNTSDARSENNQRTLWTKSAPFLTYVDLGALEDFRERTTPDWPLAVTDDLIDWLWRHADEMNAMFAAQGSNKRVHYDVLETTHDHDPDPAIDRIPFGIFPFRYYGPTIGDPRAPGYYHADVDIDFGLCHELSHQLGLIDLYQINVAPGDNEVSGQGYSATAGLMNGVSDFYSAHSALAMDDWVDVVHGYYGQYLYNIPEHVGLRILDINGDPLEGATIKVYQRNLRPGGGPVITDQIKFQGVTGPDGVYMLPNVEIDPGLVPTTYAGDTLPDNPFGYVAVVGWNALLHFKIEYEGFVDYAWLELPDVNVAYWQGQTTQAIFDRQVAIGSGVQHYPPADLAELNAEYWTAWVQGGTPTLADDTVRTQVGGGSVQFITDGGFDNYVRYPAGILAKWDLSDIDDIRFWAYTENVNSFQNASPWFRLGSFEDGYFEWHPTWDILNQTRDQWREYVVPIAGDGTWIRSTHGTPDLANINYFELHADTWGAGFTLWLDGVTFDPLPTPLYGDCNCDGVVDTYDIDAFVLALSDENAYAAAHPGCPIVHGDCNGDGAVDTYDIDAFVLLLTGN